MYKKALALDSKLFLETKRIRAKRPSEYWLGFLKDQVLKTHKEDRTRAGWLFMIPVVYLAILLVSIVNDPNGGEDFGGWFIGLFFTLFMTAVVVTIIFARRKRAFVDPNAYDHLAKFIIKIKGDILKNLIGINLNLSKIEEDVNRMDLKTLGLKETRKVKYAPYQLERYRANMRLKDDSFCSASLYQISLRTTTTKRRSSGKVKTKSKHKHKFYYILTLKLSAEAYQVVKPEMLADAGHFYELSNRTENGFHLFKIKFKEKLAAIPSKITDHQKRQPSIFAEMLDHVFENRLVFSSNHLSTR